jgi:hypothetical protein
VIVPVPVGAQGQGPIKQKAPYTYKRPLTLVHVRVRHGLLVVGLSSRDL